MKRANRKQKERKIDSKRLEMWTNRNRYYNWNLFLDNLVFNNKSNIGTSSRSVSEWLGLHYSINF